METAMKPIQILIADDDPEDIQLTSEALTEVGLGSNISFVHDGEELLDYLLHKGKFADEPEEPLPGLILLDLNMPRMDGYEALGEIRADHRLKHIPVIVLTTSRAEEDVLRTYKSGANSFITKPVTYNGLVKAMEAVKHFWFETARLPKN
jgi:CheY-like chemotaxis protein